MLTRISDALNLQLLKTGEWIGDLSPIGKVLLGAALFGLLSLAAHFGLIPRRHRSVGE